MHSDYLSFADAVEELRSFLDLHRWPVDIRWLSPGTLALKGSRLILDSRAFQESESVRTSYWHAVPQKRGVLLAGLGHDTAYSYCYLWAPSDEDEADDLLMPDGLKLSIPEDPPEALATTGWRFRWHRRHSRQVPLEGFMLSPSLPTHQKIRV